MASTKQRADKQKEKEKKEKILLVVLVLILVVVGAVMLPGMLKKKGAAATPASTATQTTSTSSSATNSGTPGNSGVPASGPSGAVTFANVSTNYQPGAGQLSSFGRFASKDPFSNTPVAGPGNSASTSSSTSTSTSTSTTSTSGNSFPAAVISINGASSTVTLHSTFPAGSQAFVLDSITAGSITVSVTNGSFAGGRSLVTIRKGHTVVLENTVDGTRYALKMISTASSSSTSSGTTTSTGLPAGITTSPGAPGGTTTSTGP
jgi:cellulose 1,4-beta-cellobiosidase